MCPQTMGGLFAGASRIDVYNCLRRPDEQSMEGGVYVVVACNDEETWQVLLEKGVPLSRNGKTALIYYPAPLSGVRNPVQCAFRGPARVADQFNKP